MLSGKVLARTLSKKFSALPIPLWYGRVPSLVEKEKWRNLLLTQTNRR